MKKTSHYTDHRVGFRPTQEEKDMIDAFASQYNFSTTASLVRTALFDYMRDYKGRNIKPLGEIFAEEEARKEKAGQ